MTDKKVKWSDRIIGGVVGAVLAGTGASFAAPGDPVQEKSKRAKITAAQLGCYAQCALDQGVVSAPKASITAVCAEPAGDGNVYAYANYQEAVSINEFCAAHPQACKGVVE